MATDRPARLIDDEYLQHIERLAHDVADRAFDEGWLAYVSDDEDQTPLQRPINELARHLRHVHVDGDGFMGHDSESS